MPLYEYYCKQCHETFEVRQKFSDDPLRVHADCGGPVERLLSPPALQFKGTGWYVTDYARNSASSSNGSNGKTETKNSADSKSDTKTSEGKPAESKPAAAPPAGN